MPYRPKKRTPITPQLAEKVNEECIAHGGDPDALRFKTGMTRREVIAYLFYSQGILIQDLRQQRRRPAQPERGRTNSAGNGGFAA